VDGIFATPDPSAGSFSASTEGPGWGGKMAFGKPMVPIGLLLSGSGDRAGQLHVDAGLSRHRLEPARERDVYIAAAPEAEARCSISWPRRWVSNSMVERIAAQGKYHASASRSGFPGRGRRLQSRILQADRSGPARPTSRTSTTGRRSRTTQADHRRGLERGRDRPPLQRGGIREAQSLPVPPLGAICIAQTSRGGSASLAGQHLRDGKPADAGPVERRQRTEHRSWFVATKALMPNVHACTHSPRSFPICCSCARSGWRRPARNIDRRCGRRAWPVRFVVAEGRRPRDAGRRINDRQLSCEPQRTNS